MADQAISLSKYNQDWPRMFQDEKLRLAPLLCPWIEGDIEHVGSTAVVGMVAKPVIDIMVGVKSLEASKEAIQVLTQHGYCYYPYKADVMHWFCKPTPEFTTHHLHLVPFDSALWQERISFRDKLRASSDLSAEYCALKQRLAQQYKDDREQYTQQKWPFIQKVLASFYS
ncbi:GrpB family protein [Pseudoalteromonas sp. A757]|uniref:GrpB family protein n=1 Tax=Pseudoalteromonas sp. A757 TaxID=2250709 RepID=UPI000FFE6890|nr:GrpB family protein [Pseudoalteromonas sp. A757]RXE85873.1 GrpB family protein [Pseudoalteromonas sp. A757]